MPIREYKCKTCKARIEVLQRLKEQPLQKCQKCGGPLEKLISSPAIQFKGSGWYITDYAGKKGSSKKEKTGEKSEPSQRTSTKSPPSSTPAG